MADVIPLTQPAPLILICDCGCSAYTLQSDGTAVCAACDAPTDKDGSGWLAQTNDAQSRHSEGEPFADVQGNGSVEFARRRVQQMASGDDVALVVVARKDGRVSAWSGAEAGNQVDWIKRRLDQAAELLTNHLQGYQKDAAP